MCAPTQLISVHTSYLAIMLTFCQSLCQGHFSQWLSRWDPHHQDPDASGPKSWQGPYFGLNIKAKPIPMLKEEMPPEYVGFELLVPSGKKWSSFSLAAALYILPTTVLPHLTTFVACWRKPTSDKISLFMAFLFCDQASTWTLILVGFSSGSLRTT